MHLSSFLTVFAATILTSYSHPICFSGRLDLVLVIDVSGSIENRFITNRDAALDVARSLPISWEKTSIAVIQYSKLAIMKSEFGSSQTFETVNDTIMNLEWTGDVSLTAEAMDLAMIMFRRGRPDAQRAIILFSDGNSFNTWQQVLETSERLRYSEAKIFAVSLGGNTYENELKQYVQYSNGTIIRRQSEFNDMKRELLSMTTARCPPPPPPPAAAAAAPAAATPTDLLRPAEGDFDGENQLPTRRPDNQLPIRHTENELPTRKHAEPAPTRRATNPPARTTPIAHIPRATTPPPVDPLSVTASSLLIPNAAIRDNLPK